MQKVLLISILVANVILPIWASKDRMPKRGLQKTVATLLAFDAIYLFAVLFVFPRL